MTKREVERGYLTESEIQAIALKKFTTERLGNVRDIFHFSCFTGLAYVDVKKLKRSEIVIGIDGEKWIFKLKLHPAYLFCHWQLNYWKNIRNIHNVNIVIVCSLFYLFSLWII